MIMLERIRDWIDDVLIFAALAACLFWVWLWGGMDDWE